MAVLGVGGRLMLRRAAPDVCIVNPESIDNEQNLVQGICDGYWSGDLISADCFPLDGGRFPPQPDAYAMYFGSRFFLGPNRDHIESINDQFYKNDTEDYPDGQFGDDADFYAKVGDISDGEEIPECTPSDIYINIDQLGRVSFYATRCAALAGCADNRLPIPILGDGFTIAPFGSGVYQNAVWECIGAIGEYRFSDGQDVITLASICEDPPLYQNPEAGDDEYDNADLQPRGVNQGKPAPYWQILCDIREWSLEPEAPAVDTTAVAEKFGNSVKSLVNGGGSSEFFIDRVCRDEDKGDGLDLMKLLLMTEKGCEAEAQFWILDRPGCGVECDGLIKGDLFYETNILITQSAVNVRPTDIIAGTVNFVTTGEIKLVEAS